LNEKRTVAIPEPIVQLQRQLDQFRSAQPRPAKIPEGTWQAAVELARQHGVCAVAYPLRLDNVRVRHRLERGLEEKEEGRIAGICGIDRGSSRSSGVRDRIRVQERRKMRIKWKSFGAPDWSSLLRAWHEAEP
jgi:hypothetical protein